MHEGQPPRMQQHAVDAEHAEIAVVAAVAMAAVADQVMELVLEVAADLAEAAGQRRSAQPCIARGVKARRGQRQLAGRQHLERGLRRFLLRLAGTAVERMVDEEVAFGGPTAAHRPIVFFDFARHQGLAERGGGLAVERQQQAAAGGAVEPMHQEDRLAELFAQAIRGEVGFAARQRAVVDHQPGGLVDHGQRFVAVEHRQG